MPTIQRVLTNVQGIASGAARKDGAQVLPFTVDFSAIADGIAVFDMVAIKNAGGQKMGAVCGLYIDNHLNTASLIVTVGPPINQIVPVPAYSAGYIPLTTTDTALITLSTTSAAGLSVFGEFLNYIPPPAFWILQQLPNPFRGTLTEISGTIAVGGTSQLLLAANASRSYLLIENPSTAAGQGIAAAESLFVRFAAAAGVNNGTAYEILPGGSMEFAGDFCPTNIVHINAATNAHKFIASWN